MSTYAARVWFKSRQTGGKLSGPPTGSTYAATAVVVLGGESEVLPGWPGTAPQFSVILEFVDTPVEGTWSPTRVRALAQGAYGAEALKPGAELLIMEGPRDVARLVVDDNS